MALTAFAPKAFAPSLGRCAGCGRVYSPQVESQLCVDCHFKNEEDHLKVESCVDSRERQTLSEVASDTHLTTARVRAILRTAPILARELEPEGSCSQCGRPGALASSGRCIGCQLALYATLGDGARNVGAEVPEPTVRPRAMHVLRAVQDKRRRTGSYRFDPTPRSIKGAAS